MADNDVRIKVSLEGDNLVISGLEGIGESAGEADSKLGGMVSGGLKGAGVALAGFATAAVAAGTALSVAVIKSYADAEQSVGGIETLFGDSADKMKEYAAQAYATAGLSANDYMEQATGFAAALVGSLAEGADAAGAANDIMVAMSDNANKMGTDMESIQNAYAGFSKQNFSMLDNLKLGYGGTASEMERLLADAEALPSALGQEFDLNNFADVSKAIQLIQEDLGIAGTTALEAESTISGSIGMLTGSFDNLLVSLGSANNESLAFLDVQTQVENVISSLESVIGNVGPVIQSIGGALAALGPEIGGMLEGLIGSVSAVIPDLIQAGVGMIGGLVQGISSALPGLITAVVPAVIGLVDMIATQAPLLIDAGLKSVIALGQGIVQAIPELIPMVVELLLGMVTAIVDNLPMLLDVALQMITALADGLIEAIPGLIERLPEIITSIIDFILGSIPQLIETGIQLLLSLVEALPTIIQGIVKAIPKIITGIINAVLNNIPLIITAGVDLLVALVKNLPVIIVEIVKAIPEIIGGIVGAIGKSIPQMISAGGDLLRGLWKGISGAASWLYDKVMGWAKGLLDGVKNFFGIKSPSRVFEEQIGAMLSEGTGQGIANNEDAALDPLEDLNKKMLKTAASLPKLAVAHTIGADSSGWMVPSAASVARPTPASFTTTQVVTLGDSLANSLRSALGDLQVAPEVTATIAPQDMRHMAGQVRDALVQVRQADARSASISIQQGVR